jgi:predicted RNA-binding protein with PIN domain
VDGNSLLDFLAAEESLVVVEGDREASRRNLAHWLARYCERRGCKAVLVFDGTRPGEVLSPVERRGPVKVLTTPHGVPAAAEIVAPANRAARDETVIVVTGERRTAEDVSRGKARAMTPGQFVARTRRGTRRADRFHPDEPDAKFTGLSEGEVGFWLGFFGEED